MKKKDYHNAVHRLVLGMAMLGLIFSGTACGLVQSNIVHPQVPVTGANHIVQAPATIYLPIVVTSGTAQVGSTGQMVNVPFFQSGVRYPESAIFWYGKVSPSDSYTDVRVGYSPTELTVSLTVFDRRIWFDKRHSPDSLTQWDGATLLFSPGDNSMYRLDAQFSTETEYRPPYQAAYQWGTSGWQTVDLPFTSIPGWRGDFPNNDIDDRGWAMTFHIPFSSLGLSGAPANQAVWRLGLQTHNRNSVAGPAGADKIWPEAMDANTLSTWGRLSFGMPVYNPPNVARAGTTTIRNLLNGASVKDAGVGGGMTCGDGTDFWGIWGDTNESFYNPERSDFNVQNESDISDFPCFSKYYAVFPLTSVPAGKQILSATLTLHQFGNSQPPDAKPSFIQIMSTQSNWDDKTITWNNAPQVISNLGGGWVDPLPGFPGWPGVVRTLDVSLAAADAYAAGGPLSLVLYSADDAYHSGKYFVSSNVGDWNAVGRPTLDVTWGNPPG